MHFRQFIITGIMVGAALLLPDSAFAERNENNEKAKAVSELDVDTAVTKEIPAAAPVKAEKAQPVEKNPSVPEQAVKKQLEPNTTNPSQAQAEGLQKLPEQAKADENLAVKKVDKVTGLDKAASVQSQEKGHESVKPAADRLVEPLHEPKRIEKTTPPAPSTVIRSELVSKETSAEDYVVKPEQGSVPVGEGKMPKVDQTMNSTQRTNQSGGQSNDRVNGFTTLLMLDKWFEWKSYDDIHHDQLYFSRQVFLNNQWVNAPPAPPPKKSSF